jgi:hypothetical protein
MIPRFDPFTTSLTAMQPWIDSKRWLEPLLKELALDQDVADQEDLQHSSPDAKCLQVGQDPKE